MTCAAPGVKGEKMGGGEGVCDNGAPLPPPIFSPFSLSAARHSAADVRRRRNLQLASVCINGEAAPPPPSRQCMQLLNTLLLLRTYQLIHNAFHLLCPWCRFLTKSIFGDQLFPLWVAIVDECKLLVSSHIFYLFFTPDGRADVGELLEIHAIFAIVTIRK